MSSIFKAAFLRTVIKWEGGDKFTDHAADPGGGTRWGISSKSYPHIDVRHLSQDEAEAIYRKDYWDKIKGDRIELQAVADALFDMAVNAGPSRAAKIAQAVVVAKQDGIVGPKTLAKLNEMDGGEFVAYYALGRIRYYADIAYKDKGLSLFFLGWVRRALDFT